MNIRLIPNSIEIYFWSMIISLLSDSEVIQRLFRGVHAWASSGQMSRYLRFALVASAIGFFIGLFLGIAGL